MSDSPSAMVDRVVLIMGVFQRSGGMLSLGQICSRSGLPRSSAHRILQQLVAAHWLVRTDNEYALGLRMFEIGSLVVQYSRVAETSRPFIEKLAATTGYVVHLAALDEDDVIYLDKVGGGFGRSLPSRIGGRIPAHCTAVGKALLANAGGTGIMIASDGLLRGRTNASIRSREALEGELAEVRRVGYSTESEESVPGVACVAASIVEFGTTVAAVSVCGPRDQVFAETTKNQVIFTAAEISRRMTANSRLVDASS